ncbi:MAG: hypothetical protein QME60_01835 [Verrucomicrobiota bacterium]|nr:hypothetical protein [Verrucomicrobiota bacterium]
MPLGANRQALFPNLPAGDYTIETTGGKRFASMRVAVAADAVARFVADPRNAIRVAVTDERGYLRQAGFQSEDLIVAFNAVAFKELGNIEPMLRGLKAMKRVYATVVRGDKMFEIEINPAKLMEDDIGGRLFPLQVARQ